MPPKDDKPRYRCLVGHTYPPGRRAEAGDVVDDLPGDIIAAHLAQGLIEKTTDPLSKGDKS